MIKRRRYERFTSVDFTLLALLILLATAMFMQADVKSAWAAPGAAIEKSNASNQHYRGVGSLTPEWTGDNNNYYWAHARTKGWYHDHSGPARPYARVWVWTWMRHTDGTDCANSRTPIAYGGGWGDSGSVSTESRDVRTCRNKDYMAASVHTVGNSPLTLYWKDGDH